MPITYVRKDNPNEVLGTFSDEELGMKMSDTSGGYAGQTEKERIESLGWVAKNTENKTVPTPEKPAGTTGTEGTTGDGTTGEKTGGDSYNDAINAQKGLADFYQSQYDKLQSEFDSYTADIALIDSENVPMINDIKATFERRKAEMAKLNQSMQGQLGLTQGRTGMARYAPETASGFISAEITNGMNRLSELESQKLAAIQEAKRALKSDAEDKWKTFNEMMNSATKAYSDKVTAVKDLHAMVKAEEAEVLAATKADIDYQKKALDYEMDLAENLASGIVTVDDKGNVIPPTQEEMLAFAEDRGISIDTLVRSVNDRITALKKIEKENRGKTSYYDEKGVGNTTIRHYFVEDTGEELYTKNLGQTYKPTTKTTPETVKLTEDEKKLQADMDKYVSKLAEGDSWGSIYNEIAVKYRTKAPELFVKLSDEEKRQIEEDNGIKFDEKDETLLDVMLGKSYYYGNE